MMRRATMLALMGLMGLIVVSGVAHAYPGVTTQKILACVSSESYRRARDMMVSQDVEAVARMILAGQCAMLGPSIPVEVEGGSWGTVQFRVRGDIRQWWTDREWMTRQK